MFRVFGHTFVGRYPYERSECRSFKRSASVFLPCFTVLRAVSGIVSYFGGFFL